jgi:adenosine deaminase
MVIPELTNLADLHVHLGSASTAHLMWEMAHNRGVTLPEKNYWKFLDLVKIDHKIDFQSYHAYFDLTQLIQSSPDSIERSVHDAIGLSYRKANVSLLEIRFNPMRRNKEKFYDLDRIIFSAIVGMKKATMVYPVKTGLILEMDRRFSLKKNQIIVQKAIDYRNEGVVGIDLSGPNVENFEIKELAKTVEKAKSYGLGVTIHTGEAQPASEVWDVVNYLNPDRIGHGIRSVDDIKLMEALSKKNIYLEICPTSNVILRVVKDWNEVKRTLSTLKENNVKFTINSDGPVFYNTNVKGELEKLLEKNILDYEEIQEVIKNSKDCTFIKNKN